MAGEAIQDATVDQCVVLAALVEAASDRDTPVNPAELRSVCNDRLVGEDSPVVGQLSEADVTRALYALENGGLVENVAEEEPSPAGKGRPAYEVVHDRDTVLAALADRDGFAGLVSQVR
jgi:hypothetical protein